MEGDEPSCPDAGAPPPDLCNSAEEARTDPACELTLGQARTAYLSFSGDQDWYLARLPALTSRSLVHLSGGYAAPNTAVNLALSLLRENGQQSLARKVDQHGQAAPRPVDLILPFAESGARLLVLVGDEGVGPAPKFDLKNPYSVSLEVLENPDLNEPNDAVPTTIPLAAQGGALSGQGSGYLATDGDVDRFQFTAPAPGKIIYLHLTAPKLSPPPPYRLSYVLHDPSGKPISEGQVQNEFLPVDLATARLSTSGAYTVAVRGYLSPNTPGPLPGDLRLQYTLAISIFDDEDRQEPNDTLAEAKRVTLGVGASQSLQGRLAYVPDPDWFKLELPATGAPTVLHYRVQPAGTGGRFAPLTPLADRQVRVVTQVTQGATPDDRRLACKSDLSACPKGYTAADDPRKDLVEALCAASDPPMCLWAQRTEHPQFTAIRNLEGTVPVPPQGGTFFLGVQSASTLWADDKDYTLTVNRRADPDEQTRAGYPDQTESAPLQYSASFPDPPAAGELSGTLSFGHGRVLSPRDINQGEGVRAPEDYDSVPSDVDRFELVFPAGLTPPLDRTWTLQWEILHLDGGAPSDLAMELELCDGDADAGCPSGGRKRVLAHSGAELPWYSPTSAAVVWEKRVTSGSTTVTAQPAGCFCFQPRFVLGGRFFLSVLAVNRNRYDPTQYKLRTGFTDYPKDYPTDGGTQSCPVAIDGGASCRFAE